MAPAQPKPYRIAIVGGGLSCAEMLESLEKYVPPASGAYPHIDIYEEGPTLFQGPAWNPDIARPFHLMNTYGDPKTIQQFHALMTKRPEIFKGMTPVNPKTMEVPRTTRAALYRPRTEEALANLRKKGFLINEYTNYRVDDFSHDPVSNQWTVISENPVKGADRRDNYDAVILASGHWQGKNPDKLYTDHKHALPSPWPASAVEALGSNQSTAVIGSGLSAVDAVLTLAHKAGEFKEENGKLVFHKRKDAPKFKVSCYSHHGILPLVLGRGEDRPVDTHDPIVQFIDNSKPSLDGLFHRMAEEFLKQSKASHSNDPIFTAVKNALVQNQSVEQVVESIYREYLSVPQQQRLAEQINVMNKPGRTRPYWQQFLRQMGLFIEMGFQNFSVEDKERFLTHVKPLFTKLAYGMVITNARQMHALMEAGCLEVKATGATCTYDAPNPNTVAVHYTNSKGNEIDAWHDAMINAVGDEAGKLRYSTPLMKKLFASGTVEESWTAFGNQEEGKKHFDEEEKVREQLQREKKKLPPRRFDKKQDIYVAYEGGIHFRPMGFEAIAPGIKNHRNLFVIGPLTKIQYPLLEGVGNMELASKTITRTLQERIAKRYAGKDKLDVHVPTPVIKAAIGALQAGASPETTLATLKTLLRPSATIDGKPVAEDDLEPLIESMLLNMKTVVANNSDGLLQLLNESRGKK